MNPKTQFESYIATILQQHDFADILRELTVEKSMDDDSSITGTVDSLLLEASISTHFDPDGYDDSSKKEAVLNKLFLVRSLMTTNLVDSKSPDWTIVQLCIKYVDDGYALTSEATEDLNKIYKKYA